MPPETSWRTHAATAVRPTAGSTGNELLDAGDDDGMLVCCIRRCDGE